jgi:hypothetical protein
MKTSTLFTKLFITVAISILFLGNSGIGYCSDPSDCPDNLLVLLRLDETSGPNYADYYDVHNATAPNSPVAITGKINGGQLFNENTKINIPDNGSEFDWSTNVSFSLECWIKTSEKIAQVAIGRYRTDAPETSVSWWLGLNPNGFATLEIKDNNNNNSVLSASTNLADNQWHYVVATRNGVTNHNKVYVDGVEVADMTVDLPGDFTCPLPTDVTVGYLLRGNDYSPEYHFHGVLDEIGIYTRALTAEEVTSFYNGGSPTGHCASIDPPETENCPSDLLVLLRLDETSGPTYADFKGVNDATATTSPAAVTGIVNGAQHFNNNTDLTIADNGSDFEWPAGCSFSLEFWIKTSSIGTPVVGISRQFASGGEHPVHWWLGINEYGGAVSEVWDNAQHGYAVYNKNFSTNYADGNWHYLVAVKDGTTNYLKLYVDGELIDQIYAPFTGSFVASTPTPVSIGWMKRSDGSSFTYHLNGELDEVAVYTRALSAAEIAAFYNNGAPVCHCLSNYKTSITSTPVTTASEDVTYSYTFTVQGDDEDVLTLSAVSKPDWLNFNWTSGQRSAVLTGTPTHANIGTADVTLSVNDGDSTLYQSFTITVAAVNHIPVITGQNELSTNEDTPITLSKSDLTITDEDNPPSDLTLQVLAGSHYTFNGNQVTPVADFNGPLYVNVIVKDIVGQSLTYPVLITILPVDDVPVITTTPQLIIDINHSYLYEMAVTDADEDVLTITAINKPDWLNFTAGSNSAILTGIPTSLGSYAVVLRVNDGHTNVDQSFSISVEAINDLPVITGQNPLDVDEDHSITLTKSDLLITDEDNPATDLTLHVLAGPHYTFNGNIITPDANYFGPLTVNAAVSDLVGQGPVFLVAITVNPVNDVPVITSNPTLTAQTNNLYIYLMTIVDVDAGDIHTLSAVSKPNWLNFNWTPGQKSAVLTGTPVHDNIGTANVLLRVNDGYTNVDQSFSISVVEGNEIPLITGQNTLSINEDTPITLSKSDLSITDEDNPPSDLTLQVLAGSNYTFDGNLVTPDANFNGPLSVNVIVKDLVDQSLTYPVLITVLPVNDVPVITTTPQLTVEVGQTYLYEMTVTDADEDVLTITATSKPDWLNFTHVSNSAILMGIPTIENVGSNAIILIVNDGHSQIIQGFVLTVSVPSGIEEIDNSKLNLVYPNPTNDKVYFKFANTGTTRIEIYDFTGNLLNRTQSNSNDLIEINIADFPKGIYLYKAYQNNKISSGKITRN